MPQERKERESFIVQMRALDLDRLRHLTETLRANRSDGKPVSQLIGEAATYVTFMTMEGVQVRLGAGDPDLLLLNVREGEAYRTSHVPGAMHKLFEPCRALQTRVELGREWQRQVVFVIELKEKLSCPRQSHAAGRLVEQTTPEFFF